MEIKKVTYKEVHQEFAEIKPDLLDEFATYYGCFIKEELVGIVSYVEHPSVVYLCHAFVKEEYRERGIYKLLWNYRDSKLKDSPKTIYAHCNVDSLKYFINKEDGTNHFAHSSHWDKIITIDEWREIQLNKILNENYTPW